MEVLEALSKLDGVTSAHSVTGPYDIITGTEAADLNHLGLDEQLKRHLIYIKTKI